MNFALDKERLKAARQSHGWSQRELGRRCGFGESQIRKYENGESDPSSTFLKLMADQLEVSTDYLLGRSDDRAGQKIQIVFDLEADEREIIAAYRNGGWTSIMQLMAERMTK